MYIVRRLLLGLVVGLINAGLLLTLISINGFNQTVSPNGLTLTDVGGSLSLILTGALLGLGYALLFRSVAGGHMDNLMNGGVLGVIAWVVLAMSIYPVLAGDGPMWSARAAITLLPQLITYLWLGSLTALVYGLIYQQFVESLGLAEPEVAQTAPAITKRVVIIGGGYAGISAAEVLERELADDPGVGIWLLSQTNYFIHIPMLSEVTANALNAQHISPPLRSFFQRVQLVQCTIEDIDIDSSLSIFNRSPPLRRRSGTVFPVLSPPL